MKSGKVRLGSIGIGMIGLVHARILSEMAECEYVAVSDADTTLTGIAEELGVKFYSSYRQMIDNENLDGVVISIPNEMHASVGCYCAGKGLHIFIEKPIASTEEDAEALVASAEKNCINILIGHHRRFNPAVNRMKEIIKKGELGNLIGASMLWSMYKPEEYFQGRGSWRRKAGGGPILINLIHEIDILRYLTGDEVESVYAVASSSSRNFEVEDTLSAVIKLKNGLIANVLMSDSSPSPWGYEAIMGENSFFHHTKGNIYYFLGDKASMAFPEMKKNYYRNPDETGWQYKLAYEDMNVKSCNPYPEQMLHFCNVVRGIESPRTDGRDALASLKSALAVKESANSGKSVDL